MTVFKFGNSSLQKLSTCHPALVEVANLAIKMTPIDFTVTWGWRSQEQQDEMVRNKVSKTLWPKSKHNYTKDGRPCSLAIDFVPLTVDNQSIWEERTSGKPEIVWKDTHQFAVVAGVFFVAAKQLIYPIRWGGDWDMDGRTTDQTFMDWGHIELHGNV